MNNDITFLSRPVETLDIISHARTKHEKNSSKIHLKKNYILILIYFKNIIFIYI